MVRYCYLCKVYDYQEHAKELTFHRLPANPEKNIWTSVLGFSTHHNFSKLVDIICSNHFQENDFEFRSDGRKYLKHDAVPISTHLLFNPLERVS